MDALAARPVALADVAGRAPRRAAVDGDRGERPAGARSPPSRRARRSRGRVSRTGPFAQPAGAPSKRPARARSRRPGRSRPRLGRAHPRARDGDGADVAWIPSGSGAERDRVVADAAAQVGLGRGCSGRRRRRASRRRRGRPRPRSRGCRRSAAARRGARSARPRRRAAARSSRRAPSGRRARARRRRSAASRSTAARLSAASARQPDFERVDAGRRRRRPMSPACPGASDRPSGRDQLPAASRTR